MIPAIVKHLRFEIFVLLCCCSLFSRAQNDIHYLYAGSYTRQPDEGIAVYQFNSTTGDLKRISTAKGIINPSFLSISSDRHFLYSLLGSNSDSVAAFSIDQTSHELTFLNAASLEGSSGACHLEVDRTGHCLLTGNYGSGSVTALSIDREGRIGNVVQTIVHQGSSIDTLRQKKPFVHSVNITPDNKDVFVPDLGTDKIMTYELDLKTGHLRPADVPFTSVRAGSGPRHFTFHPNGKFAYVIQEMGALITAFSYTDGRLEPIQVISTLPTGYNGKKWAADIHISPDGKFLYGSNRDAETLAIFSINENTGRLTAVGYEPVRGKTPRNFAIDPTGNFVLVANQDSGNITVFKRDKLTGKLSYTGRETMLPTPVCLKFSE